MRVTVLYFSNTGKTETVAAELAKQLDAEQLRIRCNAYSGSLGGVRKAWDVLVRGRPPIELEPLIDARELIVVGGPVWDSQAAPPILSALRRLRGKSARVALFVTCEGRIPTSPPEPALQEMARAFGLPVLNTRVFRRDELKSGAFKEGATSFVNEMKLLMRLTPSARGRSTQGDLYQDYGHAPSARKGRHEFGVEA